MVPGAVLRVEAVAGVVAAPGCTVVADHSGQVILTLQHISVGYVYYYGTYTGLEKIFSF